MEADTDQQILDLIKRAFLLPDGVQPAEFGTWLIRVRKKPRRGYYWDTPEYDAHVHDLCAMSFARQLPSLENGNVTARAYHNGFTMAMHVGDSAAAIKALWEATNE